MHNENGNEENIENSNTFIKGTVHVHCTQRIHCTQRYLSMKPFLKQQVGGIIVFYLEKYFVL